MNKDKIVKEFKVLWLGWEMDNDAKVMERPDGSHYLLMTNHGGEYKAKRSELVDRITEYRQILLDSEEALNLLES